MKYGLFCSKFFTDHFSEVHLGLSGPTYAKNRFGDSNDSIGGSDQSEKRRYLGF